VLVDAEICAAFEEIRQLESPAGHFCNHEVPDVSLGSLSAKQTSAPAGIRQ